MAGDKKDIDDVKSHAPGLFDGDDVVLPNMTELLGMLKLSEVIDVKKLVEQQKVMYKRYVEETKLKKQPTQFIGFIVPLDSYIPLPSPYGANVVFQGDDGLVRASLVSIDNPAITMSAGKQNIKIRLSVMLVALGDHKATGKKIDELGKAGTLLTIYNNALGAANDVITAYKLTPQRHNHDLKPVTLLNRPSTVEVIRFDIDKPDIIEHEHVSMHKNMLISVSHARKMEDKELTNFRNIHLMLSGQMHLESVLLGKIYQAIDARCVGLETYSIVLADTYAEHMLGYMLFEMLLTEMKPDEAGKTIEDIRNIDGYLRAISKKLTMTKKELKTSIDFNEWNTKCRKVRNGLTHIFLDLKASQEDAQQAIDTTINMIDKLIGVVETKYGLPKNVSTLLHSVQWYQKSRQPAPDTTSVSK